MSRLQAMLHHVDALGEGKGGAMTPAPPHRREIPTLELPANSRSERPALEQGSVASRLLPLSGAVDAHWLSEPIIPWGKLIFR